METKNENKKMKKKITENDAKRQVLTKDLI